MAGNRASERQFDVTVARVWRYRNLFITITIIITHTLTILGTHITHLAYIKTILIAPIDYPQ